MSKTTTPMRLASVGLTCIAVLISQGCSSEIDARQAHVEQGLIYKKDASNPFTGALTNVPISDVGKRHTAQYGLWEGSCAVPVKDGLFDGVSICKNTNGKKVAEIAYVQGKQEGAIKLWAPDSDNLMFSTTMRANEPDGVEERYNPKSGKLISRINYAAGKNVGEQKQWDVTGETLLTDLTWENGKKTGVLRSGEREEHYKAGEYDGVWKMCWWSASLTGERLSAADAKYRTYYALAGQLGGTSFLPAVVDSPADVKCTEKVYKDGVEQVKAVENQPSDATSTGNKCLDSMIKDFHKTHGENQIISHDEMEEWEAYCKDKKW